MTNAGPIIRRVVIRGRVQGVGYRAWTEREAILRGLEGWVRNRRDGSVEALFAGPELVVGAMIGACRKGPALARVDDIIVREGAVIDLGERHGAERFSQLPTV